MLLQKLMYSFVDATDLDIAFVNGGRGVLSVVSSVVVNKV